MLHEVHLVNLSFSRKESSKSDAATAQQAATQHDPGLKIAATRWGPDL
jgi:hypothetical protein